MMDDLIFRKDVLDALDKLCERVCQYSIKQRSTMCVACHLGATFDVIDELPSAQPEWISVTERLPNVNEEVLVYLWKDSPYIANIDDNGQWETNDFYIDKDDIPEFWMPLPEPYKRKAEHE